MKTKEEIEQLAIKHANLKPNFDRAEEEYYNSGAINAYESFMHGYTQCQQDMAKQEKVDVVCPKCKGVNEYLISDKGDYKCAYTDCQHKF